MGSPQSPAPALLLLGGFSRYPAALDWMAERAAGEFGPAALTSPRFAFTETKFYEADMGTGLLKTFSAFERLIDPAELPRIKRLTNDWEREYAQAAKHAEPRPLNLDPGYLTEAKLVLATTKDRDHRLYLSDGIFGEVTLRFHHGAWQARDWTYPDYQRADYHQFFLACRDYLRSRRKTAPSG